MATTSARLGLRKPADADDADVDLDINPLVQHIDDNVPSKAEALVAGSTGAAAALRTDTTGTLANNRAQSYRKQGDANDAYSVDFDGKTQWGAGGGSALDTNLYRSAANKLKTDDALEVAGAVTALSNLTVSGTGSNLSVGGSASIGGALVVTGNITAPNVNAAVPSGWWQAPASSKTAVSYGTSPTDTDVVMATVVKAPIGLTNSGGVVTIGAGNGGWYDLEARYDLNMTVGTTQRVDCYFKDQTGAVIGNDVKVYLATGFGFHTWKASVYLNAGDTVKVGCKVWTTSGSGTYAVADDSAARTWFKVKFGGK